VPIIVPFFKKEFTNVWYAKEFTVVMMVMAAMFFWEAAETWDL
jgi:hypothetical protein